jgi:glycosyltransferase involved in cell wall biosynthesis
MISVAMCTYNGAIFLPEQLESIANQTVPIDELVVCDDGSSDNTLEVLRVFCETSPFPVHIHSNEKNLGSSKNFEKCLGLCKGDIIFLSDQDDLWQKDKVEKHLALYEDQPGVDAVFSDAMMIDDDSKPMGRTIWQEIAFDASSQKQWQDGRGYEILFRNWVVTGATLSLRKSCLPRLIPFPTHVPDLIHDGWIAFVLSLEDVISFIPETLVSYRIHQGQQVGFGGKVQPVSLKDRMNRNRRDKLAPLVQKAAFLSGVYDLLIVLPGVQKEKLAELDLLQAHYRMRSTLPANRVLRVPFVLKDLMNGRYDFSSKSWWLPVLGDLVE